MKMAAEYLERAHQFERLASNVTDDPELKSRLDAQAKAYHALAEKRANEFCLPYPYQTKQNMHTATLPYS